MAVLDGLANDFEADASGGAEDNDFHGLFLLIAGYALSAEMIGSCFLTYVGLRGAIASAGTGVNQVRLGGRIV
jgi:hypothetical protein